ncbi:DUF2141 domain-containing protein [Aquimarina celericrescens]|uniref:DUF2141 domain-containing protein n=1 Tax=Aquimarina celericrescens TaxID=1964542 RepID=A0ABW5ASN2_9FLAO|nr:DUF2141 domain-containing protein [Aquimarina celericrescens]
MKTTFLTLLIALLILSTSSFAQTSYRSIDIIIDNIQSNDGTLRIGLYKSEESFLKKTYKSINVKAQKESVEVFFKDVEEGEYAISLYHDKDDNQKMNTFFKIPTEPYGVSNNAKGRFGPPKWEDAKFEVSDNKVTQRIML